MALKELQGTQMHTLRPANYISVPNQNNKIKYPIYLLSISITQNSVLLVIDIDTFCQIGWRILYRRQFECTKRYTSTLPGLGRQFVRSGIPTFLPYKMKKIENLEITLKNECTHPGAPLDSF